MECLSDKPTHLHEARVSRKLGLRELSARTSLSPAVLRKIDEGRFGDLPAGLYARSYVKSFAAEVGLDPVAALKEVEHLLPDAPDPLPVLRELKGAPASDRFLSLVEKLRPREVTPENHEAQTAEGDERPSAGHSNPSAGHSTLTRCGAAALDATALVAINAGLILLIAWGSGLPAGALLRQASIALAALCAVPTVLYFVLFNGIAGRTLGGWLCRLPVPGPHAPLTLDAILRRSVLLR